METIEEGTDFLLIGQFYVFIGIFWLQAELLSHQNIMMTNTSGKAREIKTLQLERMYQVIILFMKQSFLSIWKKILENFLMRRKSITWSKRSKKSKFFWYQINLYFE
jgi:hypothetical protein